MNVIFLPEVQEYYDELENIFYEKGYFSFPASSKKYVKDLIDDVKGSLPIKRHKPAPAYCDKYGRNMKYAAFKKNKQTTWYAFFKTYEENGETFYLVRYVSNNHVIAKYL
jgi:hypothetical protein